jgi:hypothetical protein
MTDFNYAKYTGTIEPSGRKRIACEECKELLGYIWPNGRRQGIKHGNAYKATDEYLLRIGFLTHAEPGQTVLLCDSCQEKASLAVGNIPLMRMCSVCGRKARLSGNHYWQLCDESNFQPCGHHWKEFHGIEDIPDWKMLSGRDFREQQR